MALEKDAIQINLVRAVRFLVGESALHLAARGEELPPRNLELFVHEVTGLGGQAATGGHAISTSGHPQVAVTKARCSIQLGRSKIYDRSTAFRIPAAQHIFSVNLLNRVRTACHRWLASASKPFWTASEKHTIAVDTMSQVRKCGRALSIAGAGEEIRPRMLE